MKSEMLSPEILGEKRKALAASLRENPASPEKRSAYANFVRKHVLPAMRAGAQPYSFQEYFTLALSQATEALTEGNYAIGAVYVYRANGREVVIGGRNVSVSRRNTHSHAEEDVLDAVEAVDRGEKIDRKRILAQRIAPHDKEEKILVTSLEPCIGCYRRLTTHKPDAVWIATPDANGAMLDGRQDGLPGIWSTRAQKRGIQVVTPSNDPASTYYINPIYRNIALEMFETTQKHIDDTIKGTRSEPRKFLQTARRSRRRIFRGIF